MTQSDTPETPAQNSALRWVLVGIASIAAILVMRRFAGAYLEDFKVWVQTLEAWGPIVFIIGYALATVAFVPGTLLTLAAGAIFGVISGTAWVLIGATLGACAARCPGECWGGRPGSSPLQ